VVAPPVFRGGDFDDGQTGFSPNFLKQKEKNPPFFFLLYVGGELVGLKFKRKF